MSREPLPAAKFEPSTTTTVEMTEIDGMEPGAILCFTDVGKSGQRSETKELHTCLAVESGVEQDAIKRTLTEFFSGHPSTSSEYNHTVSAGSAKPTSVQTRRDVMRSLLPAAEEEEADLEEVNPNEPEQFKEGNYAV